MGFNTIVKCLSWPCDNLSWKFAGLGVVVSTVDGGNWLSFNHIYRQLIFSQKFAM